MTLGAEAEQSISFPRFRECLTRDLFNGICVGSIPLKFHAKVAYKDTFGEEHTTICSGSLDANTKGFRIEDNQAT